MKVIFQKLLRDLGICVNTMIPKKNNYIYVQPHVNCKSDKYDLINCNSDNSLKVINYFIRNYKGKRVAVYLEYYDKGRNKAVLDFVKKCNSQCVDVHLIESCWNRDDSKSLRNAIRYVYNSIVRYRCKLWICDTGWSRFWDKTFNQRIINYNYCTPFKKGGLQDHSLSFNHIDYICQTSLMCAKVVAAEYEANLDKFALIGFARNDTLFSTDKTNNVEKWLKENGAWGKKIILYVPTYRPELVDYTGLNIFGFKDDGELHEMLEKENAVVITKLHPIQRKYLVNLPVGCLSLEPTFNFSVYDLFLYGCVLVSDYSSISTDFLITKKPVIYLFSDIDKYDVERGFSFDPIQSVCCGDIVYDNERLIKSLISALSNPEMYVKPYLEKIKIWHKYTDDRSTVRSYKLLTSLLNK